MKCWGLTTLNAIRTQKCCSQQLLCSGFFQACLCRACLDLSQFSCLPEHSSKPLLWAYSLHSSGQSELCCYAHPAGRAFLSSSTHSQQSCPQTSLCYFCLDWFFVVFFKAPDTYFSSYFSPPFLTPFNLHPRLYSPSCTHAHTNPIKNH